MTNEKLNHSPSGLSKKNKNKPPTWAIRLMGKIPTQPLKANHRLLSWEGWEGDAGCGQDKEISWYADILRSAPFHEEGGINQESGLDPAQEPDPGLALHSSHSPTLLPVLVSKIHPHRGRCKVALDSLIFG